MLQWLRRRQQFAALAHEGVDGRPAGSIAVQERHDGASEAPGGPEHRLGCGFILPWQQRLPHDLRHHLHATTLLHAPRGSDNLPLDAHGPIQAWCSEQTA